MGATATGRSGRILSARFALALGLGLTAGFPDPSLSQQTDRLEQPTAIHIAAGSLESALLQFGRETELQVIVSTPVSGISVPALDGRLTAREALTTLLEATGLVYTVVGNTVTIHRLEVRP